jgi:hypothetical protein
VDPARACQRQSNVANASQTVEKPTDVVRRRRGNDVAQPGQRRHPNLRINDKQRIELDQAVGLQGYEQSIIGTLPGTGAAGEPGALDHRRRRVA